jgi:hypothetical protein
METVEVKYDDMFYDVTYFYSETNGVEISKITDWQGQEVKFNRYATKDIEDEVLRIIKPY